MNTHLFVLLLAVLLALSHAACPDIPTPVIYNPPPSSYVVAAPKTSTNKNVVVKNVFQNPVYQDRTYNVITSTFSLELFQAAYLSLYNDDKLIVSNNYVSVNFTVPMTLWIAFDSRATSIPQWMIDLGLQDSGLVVQREDAREDGTTLDLKVYYSLTPRSAVILGGAGAPGVLSMYIPYFLLAPFTCSAETLSDNFFYHSTVGNDYLPGGLWLGWQYGQYYWRTQTNFHRIRSLTTSGSRLLLTSQVYLSTSFTLQTKAIQWGSTGTVSTTFVFGIVNKIDAFTPGNLVNIFSLSWNFTASQLSFTYTDYGGAVTVLASKTFTQAQTSTNAITITQELKSIKVYLDGDATPALTATTPFQSTVGRFGWIQKASADFQFETYVDYVNFSGRVCAPYNV